MREQGKQGTAARTSARKRTRVDETLQGSSKAPRKRAESPGMATLQETAEVASVQQPQTVSADTPAEAVNIDDTAYTGAKTQAKKPRTRANKQKVQQTAAVPDNAAPQQHTQQQQLEQQQPALRRSARLRSSATTEQAEATTTAVITAITASSPPQQQLQQVEENTIQPEQQPTKPTSSRAPKEAKSGKGRTTSSNGSILSTTASIGASRAAEQRLWKQGFKFVAGVDEAGRGPLAGPVVAAAVILPPDANFPGLNDSKQMTEEDRERLYEQLTTDEDVVYAVSVVDHEMIDEINILQSAMLAMQQAVEQLSTQPDHLLIDGNRRPKGLREDLPALLLVKGDATSTCIAAASVIAKVTRDRLMLDLDKQYPQYGFAQHKGYGVPAHRAAIQQYGPCPVHRRSFEPIKSMTGWAGYGQKAAAAAAAAAAMAAAAAEKMQPASMTAAAELVVAATAEVRTDVHQDSAAATAVDARVLGEVQATAGSARAAAAAATTTTTTGGGGRKSGRGRRKKEQQTPEPVAT